MALIQRIKADDTVSYVSFSTPEQLAERVAADMATLLAERFDGARDAVAASVPAARARARPVHRDDRAAGGGRRGARAARSRGRAPGDPGRPRWDRQEPTRHRSRPPRRRPRRREVSFVLLEHVTDPARVAAAIADALGVRDSGSRDTVADLSRAAGDRRMLVVLDNFEQILDAAPLLTQLFTELRQTTFLVTSRALLRLRGERVFEVQPLALPDPSPAFRVEVALESPAVRLFRDRARAAIAAVRGHRRERRRGGAHLRGAGGCSPRPRTGRRPHPRALAEHAARAARSAPSCAGRLVARPARPAAHDRGDDRVECRASGCAGA